MNTVIYVAPQGSGKTMTAQVLMQRWGCTAVVDEWRQGDPLQPGALHLCHEGDVARRARELNGATLVLPLCTDCRWFGGLQGRPEPVCMHPMSVSLVDGEPDNSCRQARGFSALCGMSARHFAQRILDVLPVGEDGIAQHAGQVVQG